MTRNPGPKISVVIPVYNERTTIEEIILRVQSIDLDKEIVIVDDASTDGTREFLFELAEHATPNPGVMTLPAVGRSVRGGTGVADGTRWAHLWRDLRVGRCWCAHWS